MDADDNGPPQFLRRDTRLLNIAKKMARTSKADQFKMGAVLARGHRIIALGANNPIKTHPRSNNRFKKIHAELSAIINAREDIKGSTLYIFRSGYKEAPLLAKPCKQCEILIQEVGIKSVCYSTNGSFTKELVGV